MNSSRNTTSGLKRTYKKSGKPRRKRREWREQLADNQAAMRLRQARTKWFFPYFTETDRREDLQMTEYKPIAYGQQFRMADSTDLLYRKRAWVPDWLWRRVASPDIPMLIRVRMQEIRGKWLASDGSSGDLLNKPPAE